MIKTGLYIHVPFCQQKCRYCAFTSSADADELIMEKYFDALCREIESRRGTLCDIQTLYFGGGTPSVVPPAMIEKTLSALSAAFHFDPQNENLEKTIEVNPGSASLEKLMAYRQMGFNRLSVGLQCAQDDLLKRIGRVHSKKDFERTVRDAVSAGFDNISGDILFGLPGQTLSDVTETIDFMTNFEQIRHISCYSLKIEAGTVFERWEREGKLDLPDEDIEREMYYAIRDRLADEGFIQYEISNFAKQGYKSRHNSAYWDLTPYLGFGVSAASFFNGCRYTNTADLEAYSSSWRMYPPRVEEHDLSDREMCGDFMFLGLRRTAGVKDTDFRQRFGLSFFDIYKEEICDLLKRGLIKRHEDGISLTALGMDFANQVFMAFV